MISNHHLEFLAVLPKEWPQVPLASIGEIASGGTPSRANPHFWGGNIPWVTPAEITVLENKYLSETKECITQAGLNSSAAKLLPRGSLLITTRATIGVIAIAEKPTCTNQGFKNIVLYESNDAEFYYYLLRHISPELFRLSSGSTFTEISKKNFEKIIVPKPEKVEQRRIAEVLDTAGEAIRQIEKLIAKLKMMKVGLLHDLLTRGLDHHGELRDPLAHPEQFQPSPLGRIPKAWEISTLGEISVGGVQNGLFKKPELVGAGYPLINVSDLYQDFGIDVGRVERVRTSMEEFRHYQVQPGDCFFTRSSLVLSGIAHCNIVRILPEPTVFECHLMRVRPDKRILAPEIFALWCRSDFAKKFFMARAKQVTMTTISQPDIKPLPVPVPPIEEQHKIVEVVDSINDRVMADEAHRDKLSALKKGLMDDLLTGRVRVAAE